MDAWKPERKIGAGALGGAITIVVLELAQTIWSVEFTTAFASSLTLILTVAAGYFVKNPEPPA